MIKINLLRNLGMDAGAPMLAGGDAASADVRRQAIVKLVLILIFPALLLAYEKFNASVLQTELQRVQRQIDAIEEQKQSFGSAAPRIEEFTKEKRIIDKQLETIRGLAKIRLREVKALDALQSLLPARTWLHELSIDAGAVKLVGYTTSEEGVSEFIRALDESVFSKVMPKSAVQVDLPTGPVKKFELEFRVGKQE